MAVANTKHTNIQKKTKKKQRKHKCKYERKNRKKGEKKHIFILYKKPTQEH